MENDRTEEQESRDETALQSDEEAFVEFEQQLADERAELERLRLRVAELERHDSESVTESLGDGTVGDGSELEPAGEVTASLETDGSDVGGDTATILVVSEPEPIELPPRSTHPLYRHIWGRDTDDEQPGEHWIHRKIGS